jgi:hypothetical protein
MSNRPSGWLILLLFALAVLCMPQGFRSPITNYWQEVVVATGAGCLLIALVLSALYIIDFIVETSNQVHEFQTRTPRLRELEAIRGLSNEQLKLVPPYPYGAEIIAEIHQNGSRPPIRWFKLWTPWGLVPYEWCHKFLIQCSITNLAAVRDYRDRPKEYQYARWFTDWCKMNLLATGGTEGEGPVAAEWVDAFAKQRALRMLGFDIEETTGENA